MTHQTQVRFLALEPGDESHFVVSLWTQCINGMKCDITTMSYYEHYKHKTTNDCQKLDT